MTVFASLSHTEHHRKWQCVPLRVIFNITQEGFAFFFELHHTNGSRYLCVSNSTSYKTAVLTVSIQFRNRTPIECNQASTCAAWLHTKVNIKHIFQPQ